MKVSDLGRPVTAAKSDWLPGTTYLGFSPRDGSTNARASCQATIQRQVGSGLILEYVTEKFDEPNEPFRNDSRIVEEREAHAQVAGRLIAVHEVRPSARPLRSIVGDDEFETLQDMWADKSNRHRWSVAFPIVQTFKIEDPPKAKDVFGEDQYRRLFAYSSAYLRPLSDLNRAAISKLELTAVSAPSAWIAIEDEIEIARQSEVHQRTLRQIEQDLQANAFEGMSESRKVGVKRRAAHLADKFWRRRVQDKRLVCDACPFDPTQTKEKYLIKARSMMDVHHMVPLAEGVRRTTIDDFALLCPTCHRLEHALLRHGQSLFSGATEPGTS